MGRSRRLYKIFDVNLIHISKNKTTIMAERAKFTYHENPRWRWPYTEFREMSISPDWMKVFLPNLVDRCVTAMWTLIA